MSSFIILCVTMTVRTVCFFINLAHGLDFPFLVENTACFAEMPLRDDHDSCKLDVIKWLGAILLRSFAKQMVV